MSYLREHLRGVAYRGRHARRHLLPRLTGRWL